MHWLLEKHHGHRPTYCAGKFMRMFCPGGR